MDIEADSQNEDGSEATLGLDLALARARAGGADPVADALLAKQTEKLEHELHHLKLRTLNEWFSLLLKGLGSLVALAVVSAIAVMAWDASRSHALIVEPFHVPPEMVDKGLDGTVIAAQLLDKLEEMRRNTYGERAAAGYSAEASGEAKLEIPDTGISLTDLRRLLQDWLGHDTHISGSVTRRADQLVLTARTGLEAQNFNGPEGDLDKLVGQGAEAIFAATQPLTYAEYLRSNNRSDEAQTLLKKLVGQGTRQDRAWAYVELGEVLQHAGDPYGALQANAEAGSLNPHLWLVWENIADIQIFMLSDDETALATRRRALKADDFGGADPNIVQHYKVDDETYIDEAVGDFSTALAINIRETEAQADPDLAYQASYLAAYEACYLHDVSLCRLWTQRSLDRAFAVSSVVRGRHDADHHRHALASWQLADTDDWAGAAREIAIANQYTANTTKDYWRGLQAIALARSGARDEAKALIDKFPQRCFECTIARGVLAEAQGNRAAADGFFAQAIRTYPSLVRGYKFWSEVKLARGDIKGAIALFAQANQKGPHFADPLEGWGEALMRTGDAKGALTKFREANRYAPNWGHLHLEWGDALRALGDNDAAAAQWRFARGLALSVADRKHLPAGG